MRPSARIRAAEQFNTRGALSIIRGYYCDIYFSLKKKNRRGCPRDQTSALRRASVLNTLQD